MPAQSEKTDSGLSITTLLIASASSMAAAIFIHEFWTGGAILGAAVTPIIVAIVSESLKKPTQRVTAIREQRREATSLDRRTPTRSTQRPSTPPPPELERPDPFGIWQDDRRSSWDRFKGRPMKIALTTGLLAFAIGALVLTSGELVFGGSVGGGDKPTLVGGGRDRDRDRDSNRTTETTPAEGQEEAPVQTTPPEEPTGTAPTETVPPEQEVAPGVAPEQESVPAPQSTTPADPGGAQAPAP